MCSQILAISLLLWRTGRAARRLIRTRSSFDYGTQQTPPLEAHPTTQPPSQPTKAHQPQLPLMAVVVLAWRAAAVVGCYAAGGVVGVRDAWRLGGVTAVGRSVMGAVKGFIDLHGPIVVCYLPQQL